MARQYCGQLGKQDNCQVAVSLSLANDYASLPIAYQLYLPEAWANDMARRDKAGVSDDVVFQTKPQIALGQIRSALQSGVSTATVLADAAMVPTPGSATASRNLGCIMWSASNLRPVSGGRTLHLSHPNAGVEVGAPLS